MTRIYKTPRKEEILSNLSEHQHVIKKMLDIQDILINDPPNDKRFKKHEFNYMLKYINILNNVQLKDYSDKYLQNAINNLYDEIFKNRRY